MGTMQKKKGDLPAKPTKIVWAMDPFAEEPDMLKSAAWSIRALAKNQALSVEPVYVLPRLPTEIALPDDPQFLQAVAAQGQDELASILERIKIPGLRPLRVLSDHAMTLRNEARDLLRYAKDTGAELIVLSSHGRKGVPRWFVGSFAETLTLYADIPLLVVHPNWRRTPEFKIILFPTDFSEGSLGAFNQVLDLAAKQKSRILLFHKTQTPRLTGFDFANLAYEAYTEALAEESARREKMAAELVQVARSRGVRMEVVFDHSHKTSLTDAIVKRAQRLGAVIALASHTAPASAVLLGSTARRIVRTSEQPVWVIQTALQAASASQGRAPERMGKALRGLPLVALSRLSGARAGSGR